jgi:hypothetical protein
MLANSDDFSTVTDAELEECGGLTLKRLEDGQR